MEKVGDLLRPLVEKQGHDDLILTPQKRRKVEGISMVRVNRDAGTQTIGYNSRPFVICGLPIHKPKAGQLTFSRRNGDLVLDIEGSTRFGLPYGQDRLIPILLATLAVQQQSKVIRFDSASQLLKMLGKPVGGNQYKRLVQSFQRIFGATVFFGNSETRKAPLWMGSRFNFLESAKLWFSDPAQEELFDDDDKNVVVLSERFFQEIMQHPIPCDLSAIGVLAGNSSCLDMYVWICYRCFTAKEEHAIPLFGHAGLIHQVGNKLYKRERKFREAVRSWLKQIHALWPKCPAKLSDDGKYLLVGPGKAIHSRQQNPTFIQ